MPEQLRFEQRLRNGRAVHLDQRHVALRAAVMDGTRHHLLAGAGLAGDQHRALRLRDQLGTLQDVLHRAAAADDAVVVEFGVALADQVLALRPEALMLERVADEREQLVDLERLLEEVLDAQLEGLAHNLRGSVRRHHHHHLRPLGRRHRLMQTSRISSSPVMPGIRLSMTSRSNCSLRQVTLGLAATRRFDDFVAFVAQRTAEPLENLFLVVGEQDRTPDRVGPVFTHAVAPGGRQRQLDGDVGISVPTPRWLATASVPPMPSMMFFEIGSPMPVPARRVVKKGSKMCAMSSGAMPTPRSWMATVMRPFPSLRVRHVTPTSSRRRRAPPGSPRRPRPRRARRAARSRGC